jgi:hypothetical protein
MELEINFSNVCDLDSMHELLKERFGFPDFYGKNVNALIDCWSSLRRPEDGMTSICLGFDEVLNLTIRSLPMDNLMILNHFLIAVEAVNQRNIETQYPPSICLVLI